MAKKTWEERIPEIQEMLSKGVRLERIGEGYGVSRQRVYQILKCYGLETYTKKRRGKWGSSPKHLWLDRVLLVKKVPVWERHKILDSLDLPDKCPILGLELKYVSGRTKEHGDPRRTDDSPSLDKIVPSLGYVLGNIHVISWRANRIKNDSTPEELRKISDYIVDILQKKSC